jgi:hypothetical protein
LTGVLAGCDEFLSLETPAEKLCSFSWLNITLDKAFTEERKHFQKMIQLKMGSRDFILKNFFFQKVPTISKLCNSFH